MSINRAKIGIVPGGCVQRTLMQLVFIDVREAVFRPCIRHPAPHIKIVFGESAENNRVRWVVFCGIMFPAAMHHGDIPALCRVGIKCKLAIAGGKMIPAGRREQVAKAIEQQKNKAEAEEGQPVSADGMAELIHVGALCVRGIVSPQK